LQSSKEKQITLTIQKDGTDVGGSPLKVSFVDCSLPLLPNYKSPKVLCWIGSNLGFREHHGLAVDNNNRVFVADSQNHRVLCLNSQGKELFQFGSRGEGEGEFWNPLGIAFCSKNKRIYVSESLNHRIQAFDLNGNFLFSFGSMGSQNGKFKHPRTLVSNWKGDLIVCDKDNNRVQIFDENGNFLWKITYTQDERDPLNSPSGIGILSNGDLVVSESKKSRLSVFTANGRFLRFLGKDWLTSPRSIYIDQHDNIFVTNAGYDESTEFIGIYLFSRTGEKLCEIGEGLFYSIRGITMDRAGHLFVSGQSSQEKKQVIVKLSFLSDPKKYFSFFQKKAREFYEQEQYALSIFYDQKSLSHARELFGNESLEVAGILNYLGMAFYHIGSYENSLANLQNSLDLRRKLHGTEPHIEIADTLNNLGTVCISLQKFDFAVNFYEESLDLHRQVFGRSHEFSLKVESNLNLALMPSNLDLVLLVFSLCFPT